MPTHKIEWTFLYHILFILYEISLVEGDCACLSYVEYVWLSVGLATVVVFVYGLV